jgi:hypothetical protein
VDREAQTTPNKCLRTRRINAANRRKMISLETEGLQTILEIPYPRGQARKVIKSMVKGALTIL